MKKFIYRLHSSWLPMALVSLTGLVSVSSASASSGGKPLDLREAWAKLPSILKQIVPPTFADRTFTITDYGAVPDGKTDCTDAFRKAILACHNAGGGHVVVPKGVFMTGAIHLLSNVDLHVSKGATIAFTHDLKKYLPVVYTRYEGTEVMNYSPFIYAYEQENIAVTGEGTLDGRANKNFWWPWTGRKKNGWEEGMPTDSADKKLLIKMGDEGVPVRERIFGAGHHLRVNFIQPYKCHNVLIEGVRIVNSPMWEIHPVLSENVTVRGVRISSLGPNNDGCDPESCKNVLIKDCVFATGDDCIAIKSGKNTDGRRVGVPSENIVIQDCRMKDGHGGVVIGSEVSGSCRNVYAENCVMNSPHLERALRIKTNSMRGGVIENIFMRNVTVGQVHDAVLRINFHYGEGDRGPFKPIVRNVAMENVTSHESNYGVYINTYERDPARNILLKNCVFDGVKSGNKINFAENLRAENVVMNGKPLTFSK